MKRTIQKIILAIALLVVIPVVYVIFAKPLCGCESQAQVAHVFATDGIPTPLEAYRKDTGSYPTTAQDLQALITAPAGVNNWHGPYIMGNDVPKDPWGNYYNYASPGVHNPKSYDVWSFGPKGAKGKDADIIGNW